jgi:hypothetical protein
MSRRRNHAVVPQNYSSGFRYSQVREVAKKYGLGDSLDAPGTGTTLVVGFDPLWSTAELEDGTKVTLLELAILDSDLDFGFPFSPTPFELEQAAWTQAKLRQEKTTADEPDLANERMRILLRGFDSEKTKNLNLANLEYTLLWEMGKFNTTFIRSARIVNLYRLMKWRTPLAVLVRALGPKFVVKEDGVQYGDSLPTPK